MSFDIQRLIEDLQNSDPDIKLLALNTLSRFQYEKLKVKSGLDLIRVELAKLTTHEESNVVFLAKKALDHYQKSIGNQGNPSEGGNQGTVSVNLDELNHPDTEIRNACLAQILSLKVVEAYKEVLLLLARERDPRIIATAIRALAQIGNEKTVTLLQVYLYFSDARIRANAVEAIEQLGQHESIISMLPPLLNDPDNRVRANVIKAIGAVDPSEVLSHLQKMLRHKQLPQRSSAVYVLSQIKGKETIDLLNQASTDENEGIRLQVVDALAKRTDQEVIPILRRLSQDIDVEVSEKALQAIEDFSQRKMVDLVDLAAIQDQQDLEEEQARLEEEKSRLEQEEQNQQDDIDQDAVDEELEVLFLKTGNEILSSIKSNILKDDRFLENAYQIDKLKQNFEDRRAKHSDKNFMGSLKKVFGGSFDEQVTLQKIEMALEDAIIELGQKAYEIHLKEKTEYPGLQKTFARVTELFALLQETES